MASPKPVQKALFEEDYLVRTLGSIAGDPSIALTELVANAWDAGAIRVAIDMPDTIGGILRIDDDGSGLTPEQFAFRWLMLGYNRIRHQGEDAELPPERKDLHRRAFGSNGVGRHGMLCFADRYDVRSWRDGVGHQFSMTTKSGDNPFVLERTLKLPSTAPDAREHGTILLATVARHLPDAEKQRSVLGSRFLYDPGFALLVNGRAVSLQDIPGAKRHKVDVDGHPPVYVTWVETESTGRTAHQHGIAFWVMRRLVGHPSWTVGERQILDGRTREAKRLTAIVEADEYKSNVLSDWSGFRVSPPARAMQAAVVDHALAFLTDYMTERVEATKAAVITNNRNDLSELGPLAQHETIEFVEQIARQDPLLSEESVSMVTQALIRLERTRSGRALLEKLVTMESEDVEGLNRMLDEWSVRDALAVLDEISRRIKVVEAIEKLAGDPGVHEVQTLHPLVTNARWIFGPEFESAHLTSNVTIRRAVEEIFGQKVPAEDFVNPKKRPDLIFLEDATISAVGEEEWVEGDPLIRVKRILIIELKRGGAEIGRKARDQAVGYVDDILRSPHLEHRPHVDAFVVGAKLDERTSLRQTVGENDAGIVRGIVRLTNYNQLVRTANQRLFRLREVVSERHDVKEAVSLQRKLLSEEPTLFCS